MTGTSFADYSQICAVLPRDGMSANNSVATRSSFLEATVIPEGFCDLPTTSRGPAASGHWQVLAERRRGGRVVDSNRLTFRTMLLWLQHWAEQSLGVRDEVRVKYRMYE
jgi:hypothetical protein